MGESSLLSFLANLNPGLANVLGVGHVVLNGAHCNHRLNAVLLGKLSGTNKEIILVRAKRCIVVSEVDNLVSSLHGQIKCCTVGCKTLVNLNTLFVHNALESVNMLVVRLEVKQAHLAVVTTLTKTLNHSF